MTITETTSAANTKRMIIGLGLSGLSCARFAQRQGWSFDLCDSRETPPGLADIQQEFPQSRIYCGDLEGDLLASYDELIVSPGVALAEPAIQQAIEAGVAISGDIQLFKQHVNKPVIAITGSNGKSTVTSLVGDMLNQCGLKARVGGNIGLPALDLTDNDEADIYVLELSSFQLETTTNLNAEAVTILNLSEDHMDRYQGMSDYLAAKQRIFQGAKRVVVNSDDQATLPDNTNRNIAFSLNSDGSSRFYLKNHDGIDYLYREQQRLLSADDIKIKGRHNLANVLAALALVDAVCETLGIQLEQSLPAIREFPGLAHRCQWVANLNGVDCYNDSKGTNVGSTLAAVNGLGTGAKGNIWLLAGGVDKGQSFDELVQPCQQYVAEVLLYGRDAKNIQQDFMQDGKALCKSHIFDSMDQAFATALQNAEAGDLILLSPACASFDQFRNYAVRGEYFRQLVMDANEQASDKLNADKVNNEREVNHD